MPLFRTAAITDEFSEDPALVRWIEKTPCYSLSYGSNAEAVEVVRSVLATAARSRSG